MLPTIFHKMSLLNHDRNRGGHNCGFDFLQQPTLPYEQDHFITFQHQNDPSLDEATVQLQSNHGYLPEPFTCNHLIEVVFSSVARYVDEMQEDLLTIQANGSI